MTSMSSGGQRLLPNEDIGNLDVMMFIRAEMQREARTGAVHELLAEVVALTRAPRHGDGHGCRAAGGA